MDISEEDRKEFEEARRRGAELLASTPVAISARYDRRLDLVVVGLSNKLSIAFKPKHAQGLEHATPAQLSKIVISPVGLGLHFPKLDADVYVPSLLKGILGSRRWMASLMGQVGGRAQSRAKKIASRANGKLGGRPRKTVSTRLEGKSR